MISWLKKHFIPHEGNDHRPHILRDKSTRTILAAIIFLEIFSFLIPTLSHLNMTGGMAAVLPAVLADLTNEERQAQNLSTLTINPALNEAAEMKANDMAIKGYFAHTSPEGKTPWYWLAQAGYTYQYAGENLAINFTDSKDVTNAWMNSPTHRANIVKGNYTEMGTGVATGLYEGKEAVFVAQVYANPLPHGSGASIPVSVPQTSQITEGSSKLPTPPIQAQSQKVALKPVESAIPTTPSVPVAPASASDNVLGAETGTDVSVPAPASVSLAESLPQPTIAQKLLASPRSTTDAILYIIFVIIFTALLLYVFLRIKNHHQDLITNGLVVLAVLGAVFVVNYYVTYKNMVITQSLDYSNQVSI